MIYNGIYHKIWPYMVQYLHFRILKFPLILWCWLFWWYFTIIVCHVMVIHLWYFIWDSTWFERVGIVWSASYFCGKPCIIFHDINNKWANWLGKAKLHRVTSPFVAVGMPFCITCGKGTLEHAQSTDVRLFCGLKWLLNFGHIPICR